MADFDRVMFPKVLVFPSGIACVFNPDDPHKAHVVALGANDFLDVFVDGVVAARAARAAKPFIF